MRNQIKFTVICLGLLALQGSCASTASAAAADRPDEAIVTIRDCENCPPMVRVPSADPDSPDLLVARHELTWAEYLPSVLEADCPLPVLTQGNYPRDISRLADGLPLTHVAATQIDCYLDWLEKKSGHRYRLPTGAEWEHFARANTLSLYPWGNELGQGRAAIYGAFEPAQIGFRGLPATDPRDALPSFIGVMPVESFAPNVWGIYDVIGNVAEYTDDTQAPLDSCLRNQSPAYCRPVVARGGGVFRLTSVVIRFLSQIFSKAERFYFRAPSNRPDTVL